MATNEKHEPDPAADTNASMMKMMGPMMGVCLGSVLLFSLIPVIGWPLGIGVAAAGFGGMLFLHQRLMGHGRH